jgi:hypothetical protein
MSLCALNSVYIFLNDNNMFRITTVINIYVYIYVPTSIYMYISISLLYIG